MQTTTTSIEVFEYNGSPVAFDFGGPSMFINATQMAKPFGKEPYAYLRTAQTKEFLRAVADANDCTEGSLVRAVNGDGGGTWLHKDVALDFARWLSAPFALWCDRKTQELLTRGSVALERPQDPILAMLGVVTEMRKEQIAMDSRLVKLEEKEATRADVATLLPSVPEKTNRARLTEIMESHGGRVENYREGWKTLYAEYERRYHVDISTRAKHAKLSGPHWAEKNGQIDNLLALAVKLFG